MGELLDRIADRIVEVRDGDVVASEGVYSAWLERREQVDAAR